MKLFKKKEKNCCNVQCGDGSMKRKIRVQELKS